MKTTRTVLACGGVLALLALITMSAKASGDKDCSVTSLSCPFGLLTPVTAGALTNPLDPNEHAAFAEQINNNSGVYTYAFTITNTSTDTTKLDFAVTATLPVPSHDYFNCLGGCLHWGVITDLTSLGIDDTAFNFATSSLTVHYTGLAKGQFFTFYAQGPGPIPGFFEGGNNGSTNPDTTGVVDPSAPEPGVPTLLGSLLFALLLGMPFASRLRSATA